MNAGEMIKRKRKIWRLGTCADARKMRVTVREREREREGLLSSTLDARHAFVLIKWAKICIHLNLTSTFCSACVCVFFVVISFSCVPFANNFDVISHCFVGVVVAVDVVVRDVLLLTSFIIAKGIDIETMICEDEEKKTAHTHIHSE